MLGFFDMILLVDILFYCNVFILVFGFGIFCWGSFIWGVVLGNCVFFGGGGVFLVEIFLFEVSFGRGVLLVCFGDNICVFFLWW